MSYGNSVRLDAPFDDTLTRVREELKTEGFGVLTEIDIAQTMLEKLGERMPPYVILGACNPTLAHKALSVDPAIGLLLPCNVTVRADDGTTIVAALDPQIMVSLSEEPDLRSVADDAGERLARVLQRLAG